MIVSHIVVDEIEGSLVRRVFRDYLEGDSMYQISHKYGFKYGTSHVRRILSNPTYTGKIRYGNRILKDSNKEKLLVDGDHEALVSEKDFGIVQKMLEKNNRHTNRKGIRK